MREVIVIALLYFGIVSWNYQPYMDVVNGARQQFLQSVVHTAISEAKIKGYFSTADLQSIQSDVEQSIGYPASDVNVSGTTTFTMRGNPIQLSVSIPTTISMFSMSPATNTATLRAGETADSEALQP